MVIFHSYVSLPEGMLNLRVTRQIHHRSDINRACTELANIETVYPSDGFKSCLPFWFEDTQIVADPVGSRFRWRLGSSSVLTQKISAAEASNSR